MAQHPEQPHSRNDLPGDAPDERTPAHDPESPDLEDPQTDPEGPAKVPNGKPDPQADRRAPGSEYPPYSKP